MGMFTNTPWSPSNHPIAGAQEPPGNGFPGDPRWVMAFLCCGQIKTHFAASCFRLPLWPQGTPTIYLILKKIGKSLLLLLIRIEWFK